MEKYIVRQIFRPDKEVIEAYKKLDVSTVYEAQGRIGLLSDRLKPILPDRLICGPAVTVLCFAEDNLMIHAAIEVLKPGDVLVIGVLGESRSGMIGELIVHALINKRAAGVVIDAGIRDVRQIRALGFPIWSRTISSRGTVKAQGGWVNAPIVCGGERLEPGDLIMADDDGVVVVRKCDLQSSLTSSLARLEREDSVRARIDNGELSLDYNNLRQILEKQMVHYYEHEEDRLDG